MVRYKHKAVMFNDAPSSAKCNLNHLVACPRHHPDVYPPLQAKHRGYYRGEDLVMSL